MGLMTPTDWGVVELDCTNAETLGEKCKCISQAINNAGDNTFCLAEMNGEFVILASAEEMCPKDCNFYLNHCWENDRISNSTILSQTNFFFLIVWDFSA